MNDMLIIRKAGDRDSGQTSKQNTKKYFFGGLLSADFWQKLLKVNNFAIKSLSKTKSAIRNRL